MNHALAQRVHAFFASIGITEVDQLIDLQLSVGASSRLDMVEFAKKHLGIPASLQPNDAAYERFEARVAALTSQGAPRRSSPSVNQELAANLESPKAAAERRGDPVAKADAPRTTTASSNEPAVSSGQCTEFPVGSFWDRKHKIYAGGVDSKWFVVWKEFQDGTVEAIPLRRNNEVSRSQPCRARAQAPDPRRAPPLVSPWVGAGSLADLRGGHGAPVQRRHLPHAGLRRAHGK